jgi:hypothetical protein
MEPIISVLVICWIFMSELRVLAIPEIYVTVPVVAAVAVVVHLSMMSQRRL